MIMTQGQLLILLFKITLLAGDIATGLFICVYTALAPWWRNPIGRTIVVLDALIGAAFIPPLMSLFFHFNRLTSQVAAWTDVTIFGLISLVLFHRSFLWVRLHKKRRAEGIHLNEGM